MSEVSLSSTEAAERQMMMRQEKHQEQQRPNAAVLNLPPAFASGPQPETVLLPKFVPPRQADVVTPSLIIPRVIMQTGFSPVVTTYFGQGVYDMLAMNPDFTYLFMDDQDCRHYLEQHFEPRVLSVYDGLKPGAYKSDLFRLCFLYHQGGVYIDINKVLIAPLAEILSRPDRSVFYGVFDTIPQFIFQAFMASVPGLRFLRAAINRICYNYEHEFYGLTCLCPTGPGMLGKAVLHKEFGFAPDPATAGHYIIDGQPVTMFTFDGAHIFDIRSIPIADTYNPALHPEGKYKQQLLNQKTHYNTLYNQRDIYILGDKEIERRHFRIHTAWAGMVALSAAFLLWCMWVGRLFS